jgi:hypothetical protein
LYLRDPLATAAAAVGPAVFTTVLLPVHLTVLLPILLPVHLTVLLTIFSAIILPVLAAVVLAILLPISPAIFLPDIRLGQHDSRHHCRGRHRHDQACQHSDFQ